MERPKVVLITGTSNGIGRATAEKLAREGHKVFASMRESTARNAPAADALRELAAKDNLALHPLEMDVTKDASVDAAVKEVISQAGRIDVVVNNAGVVSYGVTESFTLGEVQAIFEVNLFGAMRVSRAALPHMREQGSGLMIHVSSGLGRIVAPSMGVYAASKWALEAIGETYRYELAGLGIDSVLLELGVFPSNINAVAGRPADTARSEAYGEMGQVGEQMNKHFLNDYKDADLNDPAQTIARMIEMKPEERPLRWAVGPLTDGLEPINKTAAQVQGGVLEAFQMGELAKLSA